MTSVPNIPRCLSVTHDGFMLVPTSHAKRVSFFASDSVLLDGSLQRLESVVFLDAHLGQIVLRDSIVLFANTTYFLE